MPAASPGSTQTVGAQRTAGIVPQAALDARSDEAMDTEWVCWWPKQRTTKTMRKVVVEG